MSLHSHPPTDERAEANTLNNPVEACEHCLSHSQSSALPSALRESEMERQCQERDSYLAALQLFDVTLSSLPPASPSEHSPPVASYSLHVLLSVFRI